MIYSSPRLLEVFYRLRGWTSHVPQDLEGLGRNLGVFLQAWAPHQLPAVKEEWMWWPGGYPSA